IVTDIPGTTRDSIEELVDLNGIPVVLVDTAGIRSTEDTVEKIGIDRTRQAITASDLAVFLLDPTQGFADDESKIEAIIEGRPHLLVINKIDTGEDLYPPARAKEAALALLQISARTGSGIEALTSAIESFAT